MGYFLKLISGKFLKMAGFLKKNPFPVILVFIFTIELFLALKVFSPGLLSPDSVAQLDQALSRKFNDWHPVIFAYLWRILILITDNIASLLWLQLSILYLSFLGLSLVAFIKTKSKSISLIVILSPALPFIFSISGVMWKDVFMTFVFLASSVLLVCAELFRGELGRIKPNTIYSLAVMLAIFGTIFRYNSAILLLIISIFVFFRIFKPSGKKFELSLVFKKILPSTILVVVLSFALMGLLNKISGAQDLKPEVILYVDTIIRNTSHQEVLDYQPLSLTSREYLNRLEDTCGKGRASISFCPKLDNYGQMINKFSSEEYQEIKKFYLQSIKDNPTVYLKNQLSLFYSFITVGYPYAWQDAIKEPVAANRQTNTSLLSSIKVEQRGSYPDCIECYSRGFNYYNKSLLDFGFQFKPYFWIIIGLAVIIYSLKKRKLLSLSLSSAGLLYIASYIPIIPAYDYRYSYASVLLIYVSILYLMIDKFGMGIEKDNV